MGNYNSSKCNNHVGDEKKNEDLNQYYKWKWKSTLQIGDDVDFYDYDKQTWKLYKIANILKSTKYGTLNLQREFKVIKNNKVKTEKESVSIENWVKTSLIEPKYTYSTAPKYKDDDIHDLHYNCKMGNDKVVEKILTENDFNIDINEYSGQYYGTPLIVSLKNNQPTVGIMLLSHSDSFNPPMDINFSYAQTKHTALYWCCRHYASKPKIYRQILSKIMSFDDINIDNGSLIYCTQNGVTEILKVLLQSKNVDINGQEFSGKTALYVACEYNQIECVNLLLSHDQCDANIMCNHYGSAFSIAVTKGHHNIAYRLLTYHDSVKPLNLNIKGNYGRIPLMYLCEKGHNDLVQRLLENKANVNITDDMNRNALWYAIRYDHYDVAKTLLSHPNVDVSGKDLCVAAEYNRIDIMRLLLNPMDIVLKYTYIDEVGEGIRHKKPDPDLSDENQWNPKVALYVAANKGNVEILKMLINAGANIEKGIERSTTSNTTPLMAAATSGKALCVYYLLKHGANVNNKTFRMAVEGKDASCVRYLYENDPNKIDIDHMDKNGLTPLMVAAKRGSGYSKYKNNKLDKYKINLLVFGHTRCDVKYIPNEIICIIIDYVKIEGVIDLLLKYGANVLLKDKKDVTILSMAVEGSGNSDMIQQIYNEIVRAKECKKNDDEMVEYINKIDKNNKTPLLYACRHKRNSIAKLLIHEYGANIWQKDVKGEYMGKYPYFHAKNAGYNGYGLAKYIMNLMYNDEAKMTEEIKKDIDKTRESIEKAIEYSDSYTPKCFDGKGKVLMRDGSYKLIENLCVGDEVRVFPNGFTKIKCVQISNMNRKIKMVYICNSNNNDGFWITFEHPILMNNDETNVNMFDLYKYSELKYLGLGTNEIEPYGLEWVQPLKMANVQWKYQQKVYNFVLDKYHTLNVNGFWCITLGHDFKGEGIEHEFYGNSIEIEKWLKTSPTYPFCVF